MKTLTRIAAGIGCFALLTGAGSHLGWHLNLTDSLPRGIYRETHEPITRGVLVAECLPAALASLGKKRGWLGRGKCPTGTPPILKQVVAIAGDTVELTDAYVSVNGQILLNTATLKLDSQGRAIPAVARGTYVLKEGEVFLLATNIPNSWDSRYTGAVQVKNIIATAKPVWTEGEK